jgi:hypothetical protein
MHSTLNLSLKLIGFIPICIVIIIIFLISFTYINYCLLEYQNEKVIIFLFIICIFMIIMINTNYFLSIFTDPGKCNEIDNHNFCEICQSPKNQRAHHCKSCNRCFSKMDHHCPWINNCVGLRNQKYFYSFLFYSVLGCSLALTGLIPKYLETENVIFNSKDVKLIDLTKFIFVILCTVISSLCVIGIGVLLCIQTFLILNNMTTIEYAKYKPKETSPYFSRNYYANFKLVMGSNILTWIFPINENKEMLFYKLV